MAISADRDSWKADAETRNLAPHVAMPPIRGAIKLAKIGATIATLVRGKPTRMTVRERAAFADAQVVARCLGMRVGPKLEPCRFCVECEAEGETGLDKLRAAHPTPQQLRKAGEQHVFALYSDDLLDPEGYEDRKRTYEDRQEALKACEKKPLERQALIAQWGGYPREPFAEPIGLLSDESWQGEDE